MDTLLKHADLAMYRAKEMGRDTWCFFDERMNQAMSQRHRMEVRLRHALARGEFVLHYQPKADLRSGQVTGVEALLRWQPAGEALVPPDHFIGILEETGLIVAVGAWVFREACRQCMARQAAGMRPIGLAVNLSARQFRHQHLVEQIAEVLRDTGFAAARLEVELTESMLVHDLASAARILAELRAMGVTVAVDDFGTGQSSLRYLKRFAIDALKIDRSFVRDTPDDPEDSAITTAVIALGHGLGLRVVAEGVETPGQLDFLRRHGCDAFQGYLMSRPLDAAAFPGWLAQHDQALGGAPGGATGGAFGGETAARRLAAPSATRLRLARVTGRPWLICLASMRPITIESRPDRVTRWMTLVPSAWGTSSCSKTMRNSGMQKSEMIRW